MLTHPAELMINDILMLDKEGLVEQIQAYNAHCFFRFRRDYLEELSETKLRRLLLAARRHYRNKGY